MTNIAFMATLLATFQRGRNEPMFARCGGGRIEEGLFPEDADEQTTACRPTFQLTLTLMPLAQNRVNSFERGKRSVSSFDKLSSLVCRCAEQYSVRCIQQTAVVSKKRWQYSWLCLPALYLALLLPAFQKLAICTESKSTRTVCMLSSLPFPFGKQLSEGTQ